MNKLYLVIAVIMLTGCGSDNSGIPMKTSSSSTVGGTASQLPGSSVLGNGTSGDTNTQQGSPNTYPPLSSQPPTSNSPAVASSLEFSLTDQRTDPSDTCMPYATTDLAANGFPSGIYGQPCAFVGQTVYIHWGTSNNALDYRTHLPNTCPPGQGPTAVNTYTCVSCPSGNWQDQYFTINNGDINFQGAYQDVRRRVCVQ